MAPACPKCACPKCGQPIAIARPSAPVVVKPTLAQDRNLGCFGVALLIIGFAFWLVKSCTDIHH